jgi:hypothetical protein
VARGEEQQPTTTPSMSDERGRTTAHNNVRQQPMDRMWLIDEGDEVDGLNLRRMMQTCVPVKGQILKRENKMLQQGMEMIVK